MGSGGVFGNIIKENQGLAPGQETTTLTPDERDVIARALEQTEAAEKEVQNLKPGERIWKCSGCGNEYRGLEGAIQHQAYRAHIKRHSHAHTDRQRFG